MKKETEININLNSMATHVLVGHLMILIAGMIGAATVILSGFNAWIALDESGSNSSWLLMTTAILFLLGMGVGAIFFFIGTGLNQHKEIARKFGLVIGFFMMLIIPTGTLFGLFILWALVMHWHESDQSNDSVIKRLEKNIFVIHLLFWMAFPLTFYWSSIYSWMNSGGAALEVAIEGSINSLLMIGVVSISAMAFACYTFTHRQHIHRRFQIFGFLPLVCMLGMFIWAGFGYFSQ